MAVMLRTVLWFFLCCCWWSAVARFTADDFVAGLTDATFSVSDFLSSMIWSTCEFRPNIVESVKETLNKVIKGQDEGVSMILNALHAWEFQRTLGIHQPMVIAITGSTGVGKTETSYQIANALFPTRKYSDSVVKPCGYLALRGEDYSNSSELFRHGISHMQRVLRRRIASHLKQCNGNAVILMDEIQKAQPGVMELFLPMLDPRGSLTYVDFEEPNTYTNKAKSYWKMFQSTTGLEFGAAQQKQPTMVCEETEDDSGGCDIVPDVTSPQQGEMVQVTKEISTQNVIFIFVSDIGANHMIRLLLKYGDRIGIPIPKLRSDIKDILDQQWDRLGLGKHVKEVVPYLPLEQMHVKEILKSKVEMGDKAGRNKLLWLKMVMDDEVLDFFTGTRFIAYEAYAHGNAEKKFAVHGARALENGGPLQDFQSIIAKYMSPWKSTEILHVGLITDRNLERSKRLWRNEIQQAKTIQVYLQWCLPDPCLFSSSNITQVLKGDDDQEVALVSRVAKYADPEKCSAMFSKRFSTAGSGVEMADNRAGMVREFVELMEEKKKDVQFEISDDYAFSTLCDTIWFGKFPSN